MDPLAEFHAAIHQLWFYQALLGRAHAQHAGPAVKVSIDQRLRQAMIEVELADEAVRAMRRAEVNS